MHLLLAAGAQAVNVVNNPALHVDVVRIPDDPIARQVLKAAQDTLWYTQWGFIVACIAIVIAIAAFTLTFIDVRNNAKRFKDYMRRPDLMADVTVELGPRSTAQRYRSASMTAYVKNVGQRAVHNYALEVLVPHTHLDAGFDNTSPRSVNSSDDYVALVRTMENKSFYPNANPDCYTYTFHFKLCSDDKPKILWRLLDDYGTYPTDKPYGEAVIS